MWTGRPVRLPAPWRPTYRKAGLPLRELGPAGGRPGRRCWRSGPASSSAIPAVLVDHPANGELEHRRRTSPCSWSTAVGFLMVPMVIAARRGRVLPGGARPPRGAAVPALGPEVDGRGGRLLPVLPPSSTRCWSASPTRRTSPRVRRDPGPGAADRRRGADQRGGLLPRDAVRRPARAPAPPRRRADQRLVFGGLHALTGISAVPPLIVFGFVLALLYEKTGSIVPGILLHMLNNSVALLGQ